MNKKLLPAVVMLTLLLLVLGSVGSAEKSIDCRCCIYDDAELCQCHTDYDCTRWSVDDTTANLGVPTWSLLNGTAKVTAYNLTIVKRPVECDCCFCDEESGLCVCSIDCDCINIEDPCHMKHGILTHRGTRGLGVLGGTSDDEIDNMGVPPYEFNGISRINRFEGIGVSFETPQELVFFEVRSLFIETYGNSEIYERCVARLYLDGISVKSYMVTAEEEIGSGNGAVIVPSIVSENHEPVVFDRIVFYVDPSEMCSTYSDFTVAKIKTTENMISFIQPLVGVDCENHNPIARNDKIEVLEDSENNQIDVLSNDEDPDGDSLIICSITSASHGIVEQVGDVVEYTPDENFNGIDSFYYKVCDGHGGEDEGIVYIKVNPVNDPPVAIAECEGEEDTVEGFVNQELEFSGEKSYDIDGLIEQYDWRYTTVGSSHIVAAMGEGQLIKYSWADEGTYNVTLTVTDDEGATDSDSILVIIKKPNTPPVANDDTATTDEDVSIDIDVLANDSDIDGDPISINYIDVQPKNGIVMVNEWHGITYAPNEDFYGFDSFVYNISDNFGAWDTATVYIEVTSVNDCPVANDDYYDVSEDEVLDVSELDGILANDSDVEDDQLTAVKVSDPTHGTLVLNSNGSFTYMPEGDFYGTDSFTYKANDGSKDSDVATVYITVNNVNDDPVANAGGSYEAYVDEVIEFNGSESCDPDGDDISYFWDFGDGSTSDEVSPEHAYAEPGTYAVILNVTDSNYACDIDTTTAVITCMPSSNNPPNKPLLVAPSNGATLDSKTQATLTVNVSDLDGDSMNVTFYDGSGNYLGEVTNVPSGSETSFTWDNLSPGTTYTWYAVANDSILTNASDVWSFTTKSNGGGNNGGTTTTSDPPSRPALPVPVLDEENKLPVANASANEPHEGLVGEEITFNASLSYDEDGEIVGYKWDFGDETSESGIIATHVYKNPGKYNVTLTVTDDAGDSDTCITYALIVQPNRPPEKPVIGGVISGGIVKLDYVYRALSTDLDGDDIYYYIDWGDGTYTTSDFMENGIVLVTSHNWSESGNYEIKLVAFDKNNAVSKEATLVVEIKDESTSFAFIWAMLLAAIIATIIALGIMNSGETTVESGAKNDKDVPKEKPKKTQSK